MDVDVDTRAMTSCRCMMMMFRDIFAGARLHDILDDSFEDSNEGILALPQGIKYDGERGQKGPDDGDYYPCGEPTNTVNRGGEEERKWDQDDHNHGLKDKKSLLVTERKWKWSMNKRTNATDDHAAKLKALFNASRSSSSTRVIPICTELSETDFVSAFSPAFSSGLSALLCST